MTGCPKRIVPDEIWEATVLADLVDSAGTWPVGGGTLDQSPSFADFVSQYQGVKAWCLDRASRKTL